MGEEKSPRETRLRAQAEGARALELTRRAAELARDAAEASARIAATHEHLALYSSPDSTPSAARLAAAHRRDEVCQRQAAQLHDNYMRQLQLWLAHQDARRELRPVFMSTVAGIAGWDSAVLTLLTSDGDEGLVAASDNSARAAHELEVTLAQGPSWDSMRDHLTLVAHRAELEHHWPRYAPLAASLGVDSVGCAPIHVGGSQHGTLTLFGSRGAGSAEVRRLSDVADGLAAVLRASDESKARDGDPLGLKVFEQEDFQPNLHAAAGVLHERDGYGMADAVALIRAHAFAEDRSIAVVADEVIRVGGLP